MAILREERERARRGQKTKVVTETDEVMKEFGGHQEGLDLSNESRQEVECLYPASLRIPALPLPKENCLLSRELMYIPDVVSVDEEEALWLTIQKQAEVDGWVSLKGRRSMMLGEHKDAKGNHVSKSLPNWLERVADQLPFFNHHEDGERVNHVLINQYDKEDGAIAFHTDGPSYLDRVCILSLGGPVVLSFRERLLSSEIGIKLDKGDIYQVIMAPRSLLIFSGDMYSNMLHGIEPLAEIVDSKCLNRHLCEKVYDVGQRTLARGDRISLTLRHAPR